MDTILNIHQISHSYHTLKGETPALCDISFSVNQGEFLAIVGSLLSCTYIIESQYQAAVKLHGVFPSCCG